MAFLFMAVSLYGSMEMEDATSGPTFPSYLELETPSGEEWWQPVKVFSPPRSDATVAICLIVRNETVYMDEWADHHIVSPSQVDMEYLPTR